MRLGQMLVGEIPKSVIETGIGERENERASERERTTGPKRVSRREEGGGRSREGGGRKRGIFYIHII